MCIPNYYSQTAYICILNYAFYISKFSKRKIVLLHFATFSQSSTKYIWHKKSLPNWIFFIQMAKQEAP